MYYIVQMSGFHFGGALGNRDRDGGHSGAAEFRGSRERLAEKRTPRRNRSRGQYNSPIKAFQALIPAD